MTLAETYKKLYGYTVTKQDECLLVSFTGDDIDFIIREYSSSLPLTLDRTKEISEELKQFLIKNNDIYPIGKTKLGMWCNYQRQSFKNNKLPKERIDALKSIKFVWDPLEETWQEQFEELKQFLIKNNNTYPKRETKLGIWCNNQRQSSNNNKLSKERIDALKSIKFVWDTKRKK